MLLVLLTIIPLGLIGLLSGGEDDPAPAVDGGAEDADLLRGDEGDNTISGDAGDDLILGFNGEDLLLGNGGTDLLVGDNGSDTLAGGGGNDIVLGGAGDDSLAGDAGNDLLVGGAGNDSMAGGTGGDVLVGMDGANTLDGGAGDDVLVGLTPDSATPEELLAGLDTNTFIAAVEARYGAISGPLENRVMRNLFSVGGEASADRLIGGDGDDTLVGDRGDVMIGGAGADVFSALVPPVPDVPADPNFGQVVRVEDFNPAEDQLEVLSGSQGDVAVAAVQRDGGVMVTVDGANVIFLAGLRADQVNVGDILVSRV